MLRHRIIFLAAISLATASATVGATGCSSNKKDVESAKRSVYDAEFSVIYSAALEATRENYPNLEDAPGRGAIKTSWHQVTYANNQDDLANPAVVSNGQGRAAQGAGQASAGMPTRLAYKRYFIRFDISIAGGRPWRLKVIGHAAEWEPGNALPSELHGPARPSWLEGRTESLLVAIYKRVKAYAVPAKEEVAEGNPDDSKRVEAEAFKDVPPGAAKRLADLKNALSVRDYTALRAQLAEDVVWSLGGGTGADVAVATWQADPEPLDAMAKALTTGCAGNAAKVTCPAGPAVPGTYQLTVELRGDAWRVTSFVKAE